ncbi:MAG: GNAT family N-acetyltransferase [Micromonosporaceae bacterium]
MEKTTPPDLVGIGTVASIHEVRAGEWNALAGADDFYQSHEWLAAVERDSTAKSRYVLASLAGRLVGALPIYQVGFEGNPSYQAERLQALLGRKGSYLIVGARRCYRSNVMLAPQLPTAVQDQVTDALLRAALEAAAQDGMSGVALFYLPTPALERIGRVVPVTASFDSAETIMDGVGDGIDAYLSGLSSKRRSKIRREMRIFDATGWHTEVTRLADCLSEVASLVSKVEQRHGRPTPDILLRRVFRQQAEAADHRAVVFTCRDGAGDMVACAVNYVWRDTLYSRAVGLDYDRVNGSFAYFNLLIFKAIEYAAQHGLDRLHLGLASSAKVERGAVVSPLWTAAVDAGATGRGPGIRLVNPGAMQRWSEPYRCYSHAFPARTWPLPEAG